MYFILYFICFIKLIYCFITKPVSQQLAVSNKKPGFGPKVATQAWWIAKIKDAPRCKYTKHWTHLSQYYLERTKALAEFDLG
jgi:hypothetical protein